MIPISANSTTINKVMLFNLLNELGYKDIKDYQSKNGLIADGLFGIKYYTTLYNQLLKVVNMNFEGYYFKEVHPKKQIIWHHSAGWDNARGMFEWWKSDGKTHVAPSIGITDDGVISKGFDESFWAASIGCDAKTFTSNGVPLIWNSTKTMVINNLLLDQGAVAMEICNWGNLIEKNGSLYSWADTKVPREKAIELNYKTYKYFEKYTDAEVKATKYWTLLNAIRFNIPLTYNYEDMFKVSKKALSGQAGLYTHNSYRFDKSDVSPQESIIQAAKELELYMK
jgi:hypothetical protein